ncbi:hypothetical protein ACO3UB_08405 (plasmid) [Methanocaldococcus sp. 16A]
MKAIEAWEFAKKIAKDIGNVTEKHQYEIVLEAVIEYAKNIASNGKLSEEDKNALIFKLKKYEKHGIKIID